MRCSLKYIYIFFLEEANKNLNQTIVIYSNVCLSIILGILARGNGPRDAGLKTQSIISINHSKIQFASCYFVLLVFSLQELGTRPKTSFILCLPNNKSTIQEESLSESLVSKYHQCLTKVGTAFMIERTINRRDAVGIVVDTCHCWTF